MNYIWRSEEDCLWLSRDNGGYILWQEKPKRDGIYFCGVGGWLFQWIDDIDNIYNSESGYKCNLKKGECQKVYLTQYKEDC